MRKPFLLDFYLSVIYHTPGESVHTLEYFSNSLSLPACRNINEGVVR